MPTDKVIAYDSVGAFTSREAQDALLADAAETGDPAYIAHALGIVARVHGMTRLAKATGMSRGTLHLVLSRRGNPTLKTLLKAADALGLKITIERNPTNVE